MLTCGRHVTSEYWSYDHSLFPGYDLTVTDNRRDRLSNAPYPKTLDVQNMCRNPLRARSIGPNTILAHCKVLGIIYLFYRVMKIIVFCKNKK